MSPTLITWVVILASLAIAAFLTFKVDMLSSPRVARFLGADLRRLQFTVNNRVYRMAGAKIIPPPLLGRLFFFAAEVTAYGCTGDGLWFALRLEPGFEHSGWRFCRRIDVTLRPIAPAYQEFQDVVAPLRAKEYFGQ